MTIKKSANWILAALGLTSAMVSVVFLFTTTVYAACGADKVCPNGTPLLCSCAGAGTCGESATCVTCTCVGQATQQHCCKGDMEFE